MTKQVQTFTATIYLGLRNADTGHIHGMSEVRAACQKYVDSVGLCVTVTPTEFIYADGSEPGAAIGLINYPRFPAEAGHIRDRALVLAERLLRAFDQSRVSVVFPDETVMLEASCES